MAKIVLVSGSLRRDSVNTALLATVRAILADRDPLHEVAVLSVGELPLFDWDVEQADGSAAVRAAKALVSGADALVISTPSYNGEAPGALKNALDWLSRPYGQSPLTGRVVALASASPGPRGGVDAQSALAQVLTRCGAQLVAHDPVAVGNAEELRTDDGLFTAPDVVTALTALTDALLLELDRRAPALV